MTITHGRLRNAERLIRAATNGPTTDLILTVIAAQIEATSEGTSAASFDFLIDDGEAIDIERLAAAVGRDRHDACRWMHDANRRAIADLGFGIFDLTRSHFTESELPCGTVVDLAKPFSALLKSSLLHTADFEREDLIEADAPTKHGLELIAVLAKANAAGTFLYRVDAAMADLQIRRLVGHLKVRQSKAPVLVAGLGEEFGQCASPSLVTLALSALLHADSNAILILPHVEDSAESLLPLKPMSGTNRSKQVLPRNSHQTSSASSA